MRGDLTPLREALAEVWSPQSRPRRRGSISSHSARGGRRQFEALLADPDNPALLQASLDAQRAAEQLELDSRPRGSSTTLGDRPGDPSLAQRWDGLGRRLIGVRDSHGIADALDSGFARADVTLQRAIGVFRVHVGLDQPPPVPSRTAATESPTEQPGCGHAARLAR